MAHDHDTELLTMLWGRSGAGSYVSSAGETVEVRRAGTYDGAAGCFTGAEIVLNDRVTLRGEIVVGSAGAQGSGNFESCVLHVVAGESSLIMKLDGEVVPQIAMPVSPVARAAYEALREGAPEYGCAGHIARMDDYGRVSLITRLAVDRLQRKCGDISQIYESCSKNLNETMYVMLMRTMGDSKNKDAFTELAGKVSYAVLSRERNNIQCVEALLLGASGLLEMYDDDIYIRDLRRDFEYLRAKYSVVPMKPLRWVISRTNPNNHPVLRIAQMAAFLTTKEFLFENVIRCRTVDDLQMLFRAEASQYWSTHYVPGKRSSESPKRIGRMKADLLGINLVVPMIFFYGNHTGDEALKERAIELLEGIECERNRIVDGWRDLGVPLESAFDSQAMLQLYNEHCTRGLCWSCAVGKKVVCGSEGGA